MVIFLDVDGVLNRKRDWVNKFYLYPGCLDSLQKLTARMMCSEIVLASTWRACEGGHEPEFYRNLKAELSYRNMNITGTTPVSGHSREEEILYYTRRHDCGNYLILDDDPSLYNGTGNLPLYVPSYITGLCDSDVIPAYKMWKKYWADRR